MPDSDCKPYSDSDSITKVLHIGGIGQMTVNHLVRCGYRTIGDVRKATDGELFAIPLVGPAAIRKLRDAFGREPLPLSEQELAEMKQWASRGSGLSPWWRTRVPRLISEVGRLRMAVLLLAQETKYKSLAEYNQESPDAR